MRPDPITAGTRRHAAATAHADAAPRVKRYASMIGVTPRTARRHRSPDDAKGSPLYRHFEYLEAVEDPWRIQAATMAHAKKLTLAHLTRSEVIARIRELHVEDAIGEGDDNATRARRGVRMLDRAAVAERDAAADIELAALYRRAHDLRISEEELFG
jgi:hypothetical protein